MGKVTEYGSAPPQRTKKILCKNGKVKKKIPKKFTPHRCTVCSKEFTDKYNLDTHKQTHTMDTPYHCTQCAYQGKTKKYLRQHVARVHNPNKKAKCNVCGMLFKFESKLKVHARVHSGEKPYECNVCGKTFSVPYSLNTHMLIHKNLKPYECSFCSFACRDSSSLRKHQNIHMGLEKRYVCTICTKSYAKKWVLKAHISEKHLQVDLRKHKCDQCDKAFKTVSRKNVHIKARHTDRLACNCPICGLRLTTKYNLPQHMRTHLNERPFRCAHEGCSAAFKDKHSLLKHIAIHTTSLHFPCSYCGRKFVRKHRRDRHELLLHRDRKRGVTCDYCGASFYTKNYLIKHIQTKHIHKQKFKYICDICGLVTYNKPSIVMHLKYGHCNDQDLQCKICDGNKVYKKHMYLKAHLWRTHNIKYKISRKPTNCKKVQKPLIDIKVEPVEEDSYEEIPLMDIDKIEIEDGVEFDSLDYSKNVLSEDITQAVLSNKDGTEVEFDEFFVRHVFKRDEEIEELKDEDVVIDKTQVESVNRKIKKMLIRTEKEKLRKKKLHEEELRKEKEIEEAKLKEEEARQEIMELKRVRELYNERMKAAVARENKKKDPVQVRHFQSKIDSGNTKRNKNEPATTSVNDNDTVTINDDDSYKNNDSVNDTELNNEQNKVDSTNIPTNTLITQSSENCDNIVEDGHDLNCQDNIQSTANNSKRNDSAKIRNDGKTVIDRNDNKNNSNKDKEDDLNDETENDRLELQTDEDKDKPKHTRNDLSDENADNENGDDESWKASDDSSDSTTIGKAKKIKFHSHQCYICFKLYPTKQELVNHCQEHFDVCSETTLSKCPICNHVSSRLLAAHMKTKHKIVMKIAYNKINKNANGSGYSYNINGTSVDIIPSVKILNNTASMEIDRKKRHLVENTVAKNKLVKKGKEWIVEKVAIGLEFDEIPEIDDSELAKCNVSNNDIDRLGQLNYIAKKKGLKIMFPCFVCEKVCQSFSALKLHKRKHEDNPKPFAARSKNFTKKMTTKKIVLNKDNRTAFPKPIVNNHKCDQKLKDFFESNIRGGDIEFWQFLKIFNKMDRENVNDFKDLEDRTDFGMHFNKEKNDVIPGTESDGSNGTEYDVPLEIRMKKLRTQKKKTEKGNNLRKSKRK